MGLSFKTLAIVALVAFAALARPGFAQKVPTEPSPARQSSVLPEGFESYLSRPDVLTIQPQSHPDLGSDWAKVKRAHLEAVAMLLEMYPDREIYFLARDTELLYDLAKWESRNDPEVSTRLHLLNVSGANVGAKHIKDYLSQEGISESSLKAGKKILFVDTGFRGTIPREIEGYFSENLRSQFQTHLMSSSNVKHPSSRVFLTAINPEAPNLNPGSMLGTIQAYEQMPRYTDRSDRFAKINGRWQPLGRALKQTDGSVDKKVALQYMEDLINEAQKKPWREMMGSRRSQWRKLRELAKSQDSSKLIDELKAMLASRPGDPFTEAMVRDFIELAETQHLPVTLAVQILPQDLGLALVKSNGRSNIQALMKKYPEWTEILENPGVGISKLIQNREFVKLGILSDSVQDEGFLKALCRSLGEHASDPGARDFIKILIEKGDSEIHRTLVVQFFSGPGAVQLKNEFRLMIEKADPETLRVLSGSAFSQAHAVQLKEELRLLIKKGDAESLRNLVVYVFSKAHAVQLKEELRLLIAKADPVTLRSLPIYVFSLPQAVQLKEELRFLIENADSETLYSLGQFTFSQSNAGALKEEFRLFLEKLGVNGIEKILPYIKDEELRKEARFFVEKSFVKTEPKSSCPQLLSNLRQLLSGY